MDTSILNAFITETPSDRSGPRFAVKDLIATAGIRTTAGSRILADWIPQRSAPVVRALLKSGRVMVGKTNTHEFAFGTTNDNPHYGATRNPWNPELTTGGSSGGSAAAVAAGIVPLALGTDTAGSVRIPASLCGCVGFKPSWGTISTSGVVPLAPTLDTVGFLAGSVKEAADAWEAVGRGGRFAGGTLRGVRVGIIEHYVYDRVDPAIVKAVEEAVALMERKGARIVQLPARTFDDCSSLGIPIVRAEALAYHRQWFPARRAEYGADVARWLDAAQEITDEAYKAGLARRRELASGARALFEAVDVLAGPTVPIRAFENRVAFEPVDGEMPRFALTRLTYPFSLSRLPAITVPCGLVDGMPVGLQLAGAWHRDDQLLQVASAYEVARGAFPEPPIHAES